MYFGKNHEKKTFCNVRLHYTVNCRIISTNRTCTSVVHGNDRSVASKEVLHFGRFRHLSSPLRYTRACI